MNSVTSNAVNSALMGYNKKAIAIGYLDNSSLWFKISAVNVRLTCWYGETVELYNNDEKSAIRINKGYEKINPILFKDGFWYVLVSAYAETLFCQPIQNADFTAVEVANPPADATQIEIAQVAIKNDLVTPYLAFDKDTKTWSWYDYNMWDTSKPLRNGQLVVVYCEQGLDAVYWSGDTNGVINLSLQNTNSDKSIGYKCIGVVVDSYIDIIS